MPSSKENIFSVDVEDWFHILELDSAPSFSSWHTLENRVKKNFYTLLDFFDKKEAKVTCFFLGWIAEQSPEMVVEAKERGHEIASHGYAHQLIYTQNRQEFSEDIIKTKCILENITGEAVNGYRAPGFSLTKSTLWVFEELAKAGYKYDSSIFPGTRGHGGICNESFIPHKINTQYGKITELPITLVRIIGKNICFFGGGYFRVFPYSVIRYMAKRVNIENRPVIYYIHPRDIDPGQPRLPMNWIRRFKSYINLKSTMPKLEKLLDEQKVTSIQNWLDKNFDGQQER